MAAGWEARDARQAWVQGALHGAISLARESKLCLPGIDSLVVLSGEPVVPCTRNPSQRGRIPSLGLDIARSGLAGVC
jgi:hypothetical protein